MNVRRFGVVLPRHMQTATGPHMYGAAFKKSVRFGNQFPTSHSIGTNNNAGGWLFHMSIRGYPRIVSAKKLHRDRRCYKVPKLHNKMKKLSDTDIGAVVTLNGGIKVTKNSLMMRFSNENSYLNWARNGVLSSGVGVAMYAQEHHRGAQLSGAGLLLLGFGYIGVGTAKYIFYILRFRRLMELSWGSVVGTVSHSALALGIWLTAIASFLESIPVDLDEMLLKEPIVSYLPDRIREGLMETYNLYITEHPMPILDDPEHKQLLEDEYMDNVYYEDNHE